MAAYNEKPTAPPVWRESASLIICAKSPDKINSYDYKILMLKRSDRTAMVKNQVVFPGGTYDSYDESVEWLRYFEEFGVTQLALKELLLIDGPTERPKILSHQGNGCYDRFFKASKIWTKEISLRINAIRETFEEVGIFLCRTQEQLYSSSREGFCKENYDKLKWQKAVHNDPKEFLNMCKELKVVPDLWGLYEWWCWATPAIIKKGFETAFFITFLNKQPTIMSEESEVKECLWLPPPLYLEMVLKAEIFFLPPQVYELSRLIPHKSYDFLKHFSFLRRKNGVTMYRPIGYDCSDGAVFVLPGDDFYTGDPILATSLRNTENCNKTEFRARAKCIHRIENPGAINVAIHANIKPFNGQLMPYCGQEIGQHKL